MQAEILRLCDIIRLAEQAQPVIRLICFFQSNVHFRKEVRFTLSSLGLADICTDACPASQNLIGEGMLVFLTFQVLIEIHDPDRESKALFSNRIPFHTAPNSAF